jgi:hypothetical protein
MRAALRALRLGRDTFNPSYLPWSLSSRLAKIASAPNL